MSSPAAPRRRGRAWPALVAAMLLLAAALSPDVQLLIANMLSAGPGPQAGGPIARAGRASQADGAAMPHPSNPAQATPRRSVHVASRAAPAGMRAPLSVTLAPRSGPGAPAGEALAIPVGFPPYLQAEEPPAQPGEFYASSTGCGDWPYCALNPIPVSRGTWIDDGQLARYIPPPPVPEPMRWPMLVFGLLSVVLFARRHACRRQR